MEHEKWETRLSAFLDGELVGEALQEMEAHLAGCDLCRGVLEEDKRVKGVLATWADEEPSEALEERFWERLGKQIARPWVSFIPLPALAAAVVILGLGVGLYLGGRVAPRLQPVAVVERPAWRLGLAAFSDIPRNSIEEKLAKGGWL